MVKRIDATGLDCPAPVLKTKKAIEQDHSEEIIITVDNSAAVENVSRFLNYQNYQVSTEVKGNVFAVTGIKKETDSDTGSISNENNSRENGSAPAEKMGKNIGEEAFDHQKIMVMIASEQMGKGDDELGSKLIKNFIKTLKEMGEDLWRLVFVNGGVKFTIDGSDILPDIKELEENGVHILVCGTCLNHFNLLERKQVGETTNMLDIVTSMQLAEKVINL